MASYKAAAVVMCATVAALLLLLHAWAAQGVAMQGQLIALGVAPPQ